MMIDEYLKSKSVEDVLDYYKQFGFVQIPGSEVSCDSRNSNAIFEFYTPRFINELEIDRSDIIIIRAARRIHFQEFLEKIHTSLLEAFNSTLKITVVGRPVLPDINVFIQDEKPVAFDNLVKEITEFSGIL